MPLARPAGYTAERRTERVLIDEYLATADELLGKLDRDNVALAVEIAAIPGHIRGYGHVKEAHRDGRARCARSFSPRGASRNRFSPPRDSNSAGGSFPPAPLHCRQAGARVTAGKSISVCATSLM
jgi:hypothetical protein